MLERKRGAGKTEKGYREEGTNGLRGNSVPKGVRDKLGKAVWCVEKMFPNGRKWNTAVGNGRISLGRRIPKPQTEQDILNGNHGAEGKHRRPVTGGG